MLQAAAVIIHLRMSMQTYGVAENKFQDQAIIDRNTARIGNAVEQVNKVLALLHTCPIWGMEACMIDAYCCIPDLTCLQW
jgi:hypothetical protein